MHNSVGRTLLCQSVIVLICLAAYGSRSSLNGDFVFDDTVAIVKNQDVTKQPTNLSAIFQNDFWGASLKSKDSHKSYRPLTILMFHVEYAFLNFGPRGMKIINLLLHCVNSLLIWQLLTKFQEDENAQATIATALFALHPVHTEAVSGIVGRADLMFCLLYLLAILSVPKSGGITYLRALLIAVLTSLGILFKETAITIPLACVFFSYVKRQAHNLDLKHQIRQLINGPHILLATLTTALMVFRFWMQDFEAPKFKPMDNPVAFTQNNLHRIYTQLYLYALNVWILICPQWLCFDWALGCIELVSSIWDWRMQAVTTLTTFFIIIILKSDQNPDALLALGLLVVPFLPAIGIIKVGFVIAERVLYVPSIGYCLLVANTFLRLLKETNPKWLRTLLKAMLMFVFLCFLLRTRQRASEWQNEEKLFQSALKVCPKNAKVHYNIARLASDSSDYQKAKHFYHNAIDLYPEYEAALMNLGNIYRETGDLITAEKYLKASLEVFPAFAAAWMNLGIVQAAQKHYTEAAESYHHALQYRPNYAICYYNLGNLYLDQKLFTLAMQNWQKSVALNSKQPKAWSNILQMLDNRGLLEDGIYLSEEALIHLPNETSILFIRANLLGKHKQYIEAESIYKHIVEMQPNNFLFHTNFAVLYHRWGKLNKAIEFYQKAVSIDPKRATTAKENLDKLLKRLQREEHTAKQKHLSIEKR